MGDINSKDIVLEIGPGTGNLTIKIITFGKPKEINLFEKDNILSKIIKEKFGNKINVINKDILKCYNNLNLIIIIKVFGNFPYNISTKILVSFIKINKFK